MMRGSVRGANRADLMIRAKEIAVAYFATECVVVDLRDEGSEVVHRTYGGELSSIVFSANFDAQIHHEVRSQSHGPGRCAGCGADSWPHAPLQQRARVGDESEGES